MTTIGPRPYFYSKAEQKPSKAENTQKEKELEAPPKEMLEPMRELISNEAESHNSFSA